MPLPLPCAFPPRAPLLPLRVRRATPECHNVRRNRGTCMKLLHEVFDFFILPTIKMLGTLPAEPAFLSLRYGMWHVVMLRPAQSFSRTGPRTRPREQNSAGHSPKSPVGNGASASKVWGFSFRFGDAPSHRPGHLGVSWGVHRCATLRPDSTYLCAADMLSNEGMSRSNASASPWPNPDSGPAKQPKQP